MAGPYDEKFGMMEVGNMVGVGNVDSRSARIWMRFLWSGKHAIQVWPLGSPSKMYARWGSDLCGLLPKSFPKPQLRKMTYLNRF